MKKYFHFQTKCNCSNQKFDVSLMQQSLKDYFLYPSLPYENNASSVLPYSKAFIIMKLKPKSGCIVTQSCL